MITGKAQKSESMEKSNLNSINRISRMIVYYLCDSLEEMNYSKMEFELNKTQKSNVEHFDRVDARVVCQITIPGVNSYKSVQRSVIPAYSHIKSLSRSAGN